MHSLSALTPAATAKREVEFLVLGAEDPAAPLEVSIREVASSLDVRPVPSRGSAQPIARVVIDLRSTDHVSISVDDGGGAPVARRELPRGSSAEVLREEIAIVLHDSLALAIQEHVDPPAPAAKLPDAALGSQPNSPVETPRARDGQGAPRVDLATSLALRGHDSSAGAVFGFGVAGRVVQSTGGVRAGGAVAAEIDAPINADGSSVDLHLAPYVFRGAALAEVPLDGAFALDGAFGGGVDVTHVVAGTNAASGVNLHDPTTRVSPIVTAAIGGRARVSGTHVVLSLGSDLDLDPHRYVIATTSGNQAALTPWRFRPFAALTIWFPVAGGSDADP